MTKKTNSVIPLEQIQQCIFILRGRKIMLDRDLSILYGVETKVLNQAVKRNIERFPSDFMFQLNKTEKEKVVTICDHLKVLKFSSTLPFAFTEQGVSMLSSVLRSKRAIEVNIAIMRTFMKLREILAGNELLRRKIESMERKYDEQFQHVFKVLAEMVIQDGKTKSQIGIHTEIKGQTKSEKKSKI